MSFHYFNENFFYIIVCYHHENDESIIIESLNSSDILIRKKKLHHPFATSSVTGSQLNLLPPISDEPRDHFDDASYQIVAVVLLELAPRWLLDHSIFSFMDVLLEVSPSNQDFNLILQLAILLVLWLISWWNQQYLFLFYFVNGAFIGSGR